MFIAGKDQSRIAASVLTVALMATGLTSPSGVMAQEPSVVVRQRERTTEVAPIEVSGVRIGLLLQDNGRVIRGDIRPRGDGYDVVLPSGRMFIPSQHVFCEAGDLEEAYEKLRASVTTWTPDAHLRIARWCLSQKLFAAAKQQVLEANHLDNHRDDTQALLELILRTEQGLTSDGTMTVTSSQSLAEIRLQQPRPARSLAGLASETVQEFSAHVQPLLVNKCAGAGCHGPTHDTFPLVNPRTMRPVAASEQNLTSILNFINTADPTSSRLLQQARTPHGSQQQSSLIGRRGTVQLQSLQNWILAVSKDIGAEASPSESLTAQRQSQSVIMEHPVSGESESPIAGGTLTGSDMPIDLTQTTNAPPQAIRAYTTLFPPRLTAQRSSENQFVMAPAAFSGPENSLVTDSGRHTPAAKHHFALESELEAQPRLLSSSATASFPRSEGRQKQDAQFLEAATQAIQSDAFDPDEFNRRYHTGDSHLATDRLSGSPDVAETGALTTQPIRTEGFGSGPIGYD